MTAELAVGGIVLVLIGVFLGGYVYDTHKYKSKNQQKP